MSDYQAGYAAAKAQAAAIARLYEDELRRMAVDTWMSSPIHRGDFSAAARGKELELWMKGEAVQAAENIAGAIEAMKEPTDDQIRI
jgi:hypothetical protein